jgi:oxygen-independent coproporphyrinogen-3 oxidase
MAWLREAGVASINLDLMYGLPNQTTEDTLETLDQVLRLRPDRVALFGYAHVPWMKTHQKLIREAELPGPHERLDQSEAAAARLIEAGYVRIGLDHFALEGDSMTAALRAGTLHRNFQGYTTDEASTLIGMGASAIGALPQGFVQNQSQELAWRAAVSEGRLPVVRGVPLTADDRYRAEIIERLMCDLEVDLAAVSARHDRSAAELGPERDRLRDFEADGLVEIAGDTIRVTEQGRLLVRSVSAVFDAYFSVAAGRHSKAI